MDIFIDLYQQRRIVEAESTARDARFTAKQMANDVDKLSERTEATTLACQALWEIVRDKLGVADHEILEKMQEIDLRDGRADGRISPSGFVCPDCKRRNSNARRNCLYCGFKLPVKHVFEKSR